jgi:hypothetical protein
MSEKDYLEALKDAEKDVKILSDENIILRATVRKLEREADLWMKRAQEGGCLDFAHDTLCGSSSNALLLFAIGRDKETAKEDYPRDEDDWGRCERTIKTIPSKEWLVRVFELTQLNGWKEFEGKLVVATTARMLELIKEEKTHETKQKVSRMRK